MILDDGGDATGLVMLGSKAEQDITVLDNPGNEEETFLFASIKKKLAQDPSFYSRTKAQIQGVTEETTTGVARLYKMQKSGELPFPPSTSTTRSPRASSTTSMAVASRWWTASSGRPM